MNQNINKRIGVEGTTYEVFGYDAVPRLTSVQNDDSTVTMQYDSLSNLLQETQQIGTQSVKSVASQYDELRFRTSLTYPNTQQITFVPDGLSRLYQIKDSSSNVIAGYTYAGPGRITGRSYLNGTSLSISYDGGKRATGYSHGGIIGNFNYAFDKENNKKYEKRSHDTKGDAYRYDAIYQLTGVKYGVPNGDFNPANNYSDYTNYDSREEFSLDGVGNRITMTDSTTITYTTNTLNQYTQISGTSLVYDNNGNLKDDGVNTYIYDYANRLLKVTRKSDSKVLGEYKYDALGRRIYKKAWSGSAYIETYFYYDGARCIEERNSSDVVVKSYVYGNGIDEVLTVEQGSNTYYYHENSLGSIYAVTDDIGDVIERYKYDAYGKVIFLDASDNPITQSSIGNRILFTGREYDTETGLYYYRARCYSPTLGRFLQRDNEYNNIGNLYTYVSNNPVNLIDPTGWREKIATSGMSVSQPFTYGVPILAKEKVTPPCPMLFASILYSHTFYTVTCDYNCKFTGKWEFRCRGLCFWARSCLYDCVITDTFYVPPCAERISKWILQYGSCSDTTSYTGAASY